MTPYMRNRPGPCAVENLWAIMEGSPTCANTFDANTNTPNDHGSSS